MGRLPATRHFPELRFSGQFRRADDGTRTHDLLHGNGEQPFASVRCRSLNRLVERIPGAPFACERTRTNAECCHCCHVPAILERHGGSVEKFIATP
jgi:hypothetical protein